MCIQSALKFALVESGTQSSHNKRTACVHSEFQSERKGSNEIHHRCSIICRTTLVMCHLLWLRWLVMCTCILLAIESNRINIETTAGGGLVWCLSRSKSMRIQCKQAFRGLRSTEVQKYTFSWNEAKRTLLCTHHVYTCNELYKRHPVKVMIICILFSKYVPKVRVAVRDCSRHVAHACLVCIPLSGDSCWSPHHAAFPGTHNEPSIHINHLQVPLYGSLICHILPEIEMYIQPTQCAVWAK